MANSWAQLLGIVGVVARSSRGLAQYVAGLLGDGLEGVDGSSNDRKRATTCCASAFHSAVAIHFRASPGTDDFTFTNLDLWKLFAHLAKGLPGHRA
jgi:hypothetical protein